MLRSIRNKGLRRFAETGDASKLGVPHAARVKRILSLLDAATRPEALNIPGYRFHGLKGREKGRSALDASANYRITFGWDGEDAIDVDRQDYH